MIPHRVCRCRFFNKIFYILKVPPNNISVEEIWKDNQENGDTMVQLKYLVAESNPKSSYELTGVKNIQRTLVSRKYKPENDSTYGWTLSAVSETLERIPELLLMSCIKRRNGSLSILVYDLQTIVFGN